MSEKPAIVEVRQVRKDDWVPYQGPEGGEGWQNVQSGEVIYDDTPPGDSNIEPEDYYGADEGELLDAVEAVTEEDMSEEWGDLSADELRHAIQDLSDPDQLAEVIDALSQDGGGELISEITGHLSSVPVYPNPEDTEVENLGDYANENEYDLTNPNSLAYSLTEVGIPGRHATDIARRVLGDKPTNTEGPHTVLDPHNSDVPSRPGDDEEEDEGEDEEEGAVSEVVDVPEPTDGVLESFDGTEWEGTTESQVYNAVSTYIGSGVTPDQGGVNKFEWDSFMDSVDQGILKEAFINSTLYDTESHLSVPGSPRNIDSEYSPSLREGSGSNTESIAVVTSRMDGEVLEESVEELIPLIEEQFPEESDPLGADSQYEMKEKIFGAAVKYSPDHETRIELMEQYSDDEAMESVAGSMEIALTEDYDSFRDDFVSEYTTEASTALGILAQCAGDNVVSGDVVTWAGGIPVGDSVAPPPQMVRNLEKMNSEVQDYYDKDTVTLYRGVDQEITTHSALESWTSSMDVAMEFGDNVLEAQVDIEDVLMTHEVFEEQWTDQFEDEAEWAVFGGGFV